MKDEQMSEDEAKKIFLDLFFWVSQNRIEWLRECIDIRKAELEKVMKK